MLALAVAAAAGAVLLAVPRRPRVVDPPRGPAEGRVGRDPGREGLVRRWRLLWALLAGAGSAALVGGPAAPAVGAVAGVVVWLLAGRVEPREARVRREEVGRDLPHVVTLFAAALRSGAAPGRAVEIVCRALPGAAADQLSATAARLSLGGDPGAVWSELADDPALGPLGRTMARAHRTGAPVVAAVEALSEDLARTARAQVEDRARAVGVRAAVPLGVCLLPAFLLLGIVPVVAGLVDALSF